MNRSHYVELVEEYIKESNRIERKQFTKNERNELERYSRLAKRTYFRVWPPEYPTLPQLLTDIFMNIFHIKDDEEFNNNDLKNKVCVELMYTMSHSIPDLPPGSIETMRRSRSGYEKREKLTKYIYKKELKELRDKYHKLGIKTVDV
jgi:hypothetical protein